MACRLGELASSTTRKCATNPRASLVDIAGVTRQIFQQIYSACNVVRQARSVDCVLRWLGYHAATSKPGAARLLDKRARTRRVGKRRNICAAMLHLGYAIMAPDNREGTGLYGWALRRVAGNVDALCPGIPLHQPDSQDLGCTGDEAVARCAGSVQPSLRMPSQM